MKLTETEMLKIQVAQLAEANAVQARVNLVLTLQAKYGLDPAAPLNFTADGTIIEPLKSVPETAEVPGG